MRAHRPASCTSDRNRQLISVITLRLSHDSNCDFTVCFWMKASDTQSVCVFCLSDSRTRARLRGLGGSERKMLNSDRLHSRLILSTLTADSLLRQINPVTPQTRETERKTETHRQSVHSSNVTLQKRARQTYIWRPYKIPHFVTD